MPQLDPGSPDSQREGCTCDARKNMRGLGAGKNGRGETLWIINPRCGLHGDEKARAAYAKRIAKQGRS